MKKRITSKKKFKKTKSAARSILKKTRSFIGKANKMARKTAGAVQKEWKRERPRREEYMQNARKVGGDVVKTIRRDIAEIRRTKQNKKGKRK